MKPVIDPQRIAEIRAAWAADRLERREAFRRDWPYYVVDFAVSCGLGVVLGLSGVLWALDRYAESLEFPAALAAPFAGDKPGPRRSANSASPEGGSVGAGYGVPNPMSTCVPPVPDAIAPDLRAPVKGIVTRMGQDPQGLGGVAIEPGPAGVRPASSGAAVSCCGLHGVCAGAATAGQACAARAGAARIHAPSSNTGVNKVSGGWA